jgi:hypothetical protein
MRFALKPHHLLLLALIAPACKDNGPSGPPGDPASMAIVAGNPTAPANTELAGLTLVVRDAKNRPVPDQTVAFAVLEGGGSIQVTSATTGSDGTLTVPAWRLGRLAVPQKLRATVGSVTFDIEATVQTSYNIVLRYYGTQPTQAQQTLFNNAAARIRAVITGELANVNSGSSFDISACTPGQTTTLNNETIDDVVIYVRLTSMDGPGNVIASAGPCFVRSGKSATSSGVDSLTTVIGTMQFDLADLPSLREETILHEMLHVVGVGAMWPDPHPDGWGLIQGAGGPNPQYTGANGRLGCQEVGGTVTCASTVPVEDTLGPGTRDVHWEENVFDTELMTGFIEAGTTAMPFSIMTVRSLIDIGYTVNLSNADPFTKPFGPIITEQLAVRRQRWEIVAPVPITAIDSRARVVRVLRSAP